MPHWRGTTVAGLTNLKQTRFRAIESAQSSARASAGPSLDRASQARGFGSGNETITGTFTGTPPESLVLLCPLVYPGVTMCPASIGDAIKMWC